MISSALFRFALALPATVLLFAGCGEKAEPTAAPGPPTLIEPNIAVGKIHAGMTTGQVVAALGEPPRRPGEALEYPQLGLAVLPGPDGVVSVVMCGDVTGISGPFVKAFTGRTKEGIGMFSTRAEVLQAYGEPSADEKTRLGLESLRYDRLGMTFTLDGGKVHHIIVRLPEPAETNQNMRIDLAPEPSQK